MKCLNFCFDDIDKLQKRIFSRYLLCIPDVYEKKFALTDYKDVFSILLKHFYLEI
jgi:hypothetical protein